MNYERNLKYFNNINNTNNAAKAAPFFGIGFFLIIVGLATFGIALDAEMYFLCFLPAIGCFLCAAGAIIAKKTTVSDAVSDEEIDAELRRYFENQNLKDRAFEKLGLDESEVMEIEPIYFYGYHFDGVNQVKIGKDNRARSTQGRVVYFFFAKNEVHCYTHTASLVNNFYSEDTDTYFYSDIVSVSTVTTNGAVLPNPQVQASQRYYQYDCFKLTTTGGTSIQAALYNKSSIEHSINKMRNLIKAKKQG